MSNNILELFQTAFGSNVAIDHNTSQVNISSGTGIDASYEAGKEQIHKRFHTYRTFLKDVEDPEHTADSNALSSEIEQTHHDPPADGRWGKVIW